jgi:ribosomal protein S18 acetylase RimI-like enzyme
VTISIRPARPEDAEFVAWIMFAAGRSHLPWGFWDQYVMGTEDECLEFLKHVALASKPHPFHYSTFTLAEEGGRVLAGLGGYDPVTLGIDKYLELLPGIFLSAGWPEERQIAVFERIESFLTCLSDDAPGAWIVESVAAIPEARRRGITTMLLQHTLGQARERGYPLAQITVIIGNTAAQNAYEKVGFRTAGEKRSPEFEATYGSPGMRRLLVEL